MIESLYTYAMVISLTLLFFMGGFLVFGAVPEALKSSIYRTSRRVAGLTYLICAAQILVVSSLNLRLIGSYFAPVSCLVTYYLMAILFAFSFSRLVGDKQYFNRSKMILYLSAWMLYAVMMYGAVIFFDDDVAWSFLMFGSGLYVVITLLLVVLFYKAYRSAIKIAENYYSDNVESIISWISKSVYQIIALGLLGSVLAFCSQIFVAIFTIYALGLFIYIYSRFVNMMIDIPNFLDSKLLEIEDAVPCECGECVDCNVVKLLDASLNADLVEMLDKKLNEWIAAKGYLSPGVSIIQMANDMCTNRTYLSKYINTKYNLSFREWVLSLRIEDAQRMLLESDRMQVAQIANYVGFASPASFTRAFTKQVGVSPLKWREHNLTSGEVAES